MDVNPDDFKPQPDRPFEVGDRVWAMGFGGADDPKDTHQVGTVVGRWLGSYIKVNLDSGVEAPYLPSELHHLAPESTR